MKKLLIFLFSLMISFNSYGGWFDKTICVETGVQNIDGILYLPKKTNHLLAKTYVNMKMDRINQKEKLKTAR